MPKRGSKKPKYTGPYYIPGSTIAYATLDEAWAVVERLYAFKDKEIQYELAL